MKFTRKHHARPVKVPIKKLNVYRASLGSSMTLRDGHRREKSSNLHEIQTFAVISSSFSFSRAARSTSSCRRGASTLEICAALDVKPFTRDRSTANGAAARAGSTKRWGQKRFMSPVNSQELPGKAHAILRVSITPQEGMASSLLGKIVILALHLTTQATQHHVAGYDRTP